MSQASILVVSFNTRAMTLACIESVFSESKSEIEVIVVDNASSDGSAEAIAARFPQVNLIASPVNLGFAAANNLAAKEATGKYILLLNPDTVVLNGAIDALVAFAEAHPEAGIWGGRTVFGDGRLNPTSCWAKPTVWNAFCRAVGLSSVFKTSSWLNGDSYGGWNRDTVREVDMVSGCFLLIRRDLWVRLGGFDTSYFMYGEDWDLCLRARKLGCTCLFCPDAEIIHYGGASERVRADKLVRLFSTKVKLYRAHWPPVQARLLTTMLLVWTLRGRVTESVGRVVGRSTSDDGWPWREVWRRRREWLHP